MRITQAILDDLTTKAKASERLRMNLDLRDSAEAIEGLAAYRGCQAGCNYAEAFEVVLRRL